MELLLKTKLLKENAKLPVRAHQYDAGLDLFSTADYTIPYGSIIEVSTGIAVEIPPGTVGLVLDKSGLGAKGIKVFGGVIDAEYRGEVIVVVARAALPDGVLHLTRESTIHIKAGDKIAQLVLLPILLPIPYQVDELTDTARGVNGFGSTGT